MCSSTAETSRSRSSSATFASDDAGCSTGVIARSRSICSIARRTGVIADVRPSATPSSRVPMYCSIIAG
jgi:hypothetical protein